MSRTGKRLAGFTAGIATQAFFLLTVVYLFSFLRFGGQPQTANTLISNWLLTDILLAMQFVIPHSILLHPATRRRLNHLIIPEFYGLFYCAVTCMSLMLVFHFWQSNPHTVWDLSGNAKTAVVACFYSSWGMLIYSLALTGAGYQTGWTQWQFWLRGTKMPRREFVATGLYRWLRHPVYLSFLGLIWFTPRMTMDHVVLTAIWTVYIFTGSVLKDRRLAFYLGNTYRHYQQSVPGYPGISFGPLGRLHSPKTEECRYLTPQHDAFSRKSA